MYGFVGVFFLCWGVGFFFFFCFFFLGGGFWGWFPPPRVVVGGGGMSENFTLRSTRKGGRDSQRWAKRGKGGKGKEGFLSHNDSRSDGAEGGGEKGLYLSFSTLR